MLVSGMSINFMRTITLTPILVNHIQGVTIELVDVSIVNYSERADGDYHDKIGAKTGSNYESGVKKAGQGVGSLFLAQTIILQLMMLRQMM